MTIRLAPCLSANMETQLLGGVGGPGGKYNFVRIQDQEYYRMDLMLERSPPVRTALETLCAALFFAGVIIQKKGFKLSEGQNQRFQGPWLAFAREWVLHAFAHGVVVTNEPPDNDDPVVLRPNSINLGISFQQDGTRVYFVTPRTPKIGPPRIGDSNSRQSLNRVKVYEIDAPSMSGSKARLNSPLQSLRQIDALYNSTVDCFVRASRRLANPAIFTVSSAHNPNATEMKRDYQRYGEATDRRYEERLDTEMNELRMSVNHEASMRAANTAGSSAPDDFIADRDPVSGADRYPIHPSSIPYHNAWVDAPPGRLISQGPQAQAPTVLIALRDQLEDAVGQVTGVPSQLWGTKRQAAAVNQQIMSTFFATLNKWRTRMTYVFGIEIDVRFGESEVKHIVKTFDPSKLKLNSGGGGAAIGEEEEDLIKDMKDHVGNHKIEVLFPAVADPLAVDQAYDRKAINEETYAKLMSRYYGFAESDYDVDRMKEYHDLQMKVLKLQATPAPPTPAAGSKKSAPAKKPAATRKIYKPKPTSKSTAFRSLKPKISPDAARTGGGKSMNTSAAQAKTHVPPAGNKR